MTFRLSTFLLLFLVSPLSWSGQEPWGQLDWKIPLSEFQQEGESPAAGVPWTLKANGERQLKILAKANLEEKEAQKILANKIVQTALLYEPQAAAYPGMFTRDSNCKKQFNLRPAVKKLKHQISSHFDLPATPNLIFGSCHPDQETLRAQILLLYCKAAKTYFEIRYFFPREQSYPAADVAQCPAQKP